MKLWSIVTPKFCNKGVSYSAAHLLFQGELVDLYGGFTAVEVCGGWRDSETQTIYYEKGIEYRVLSEDEPALVSLATEHFPDQLAFCMTHAGEGEVYSAAKPVHTFPLSRLAVDCRVDD